MFQTFLFISLIALAVAMIIYIIRILIGPSVTDRILALDGLGITLIGFIGIIMILQETIAYSDVVLVLSILAFVSTVALSKFVERGEVFERD